MQQYIKEVKKIFSATANQDGFLGIRVCHKDLTSVKALILGINPSNSIKAFGRTEFRQQLRNDNSAFLDQVLSSQNAYEEFLSFAHYQKNEARICKLEIYAHAFHPHFQKHNQFAKALGIDEQYAFFDLFPIWEIQQAALLDKLNQKPAVSAQLISAFIQLLIAHPQIQQLYFFNKKSYHLFLKFIAIQSTVQILAKKELGLLENELSRLLDLYARRNKQLWIVDREFVYEEIGEVIHHCLTVQFSQLNVVLSDVLRAKMQVINAEKKQNIFGRFFQFDFRDIADAALLSEFSAFEIEIIELEYAAEKTKINKAIRRLYQSDIYQIGDGVMVQTPVESLYIHEQNERNHYLKIQNTNSIECKTCIGPPKASRCSTIVLATQK